MNNLQSVINSGGRRPFAASGAIWLIAKDLNSIERKADMALVKNLAQFASDQHLFDALLDPWDGSVNNFVQTRFTLMEGF